MIYAQGHAQDIRGVAALNSKRHLHISNSEHYVKVVHPSLSCLISNRLQFLLLKP